MVWSRNIDKISKDSVWQKVSILYPKNLTMYSGSNRYQFLPLLFLTYIIFWSENTVALEHHTWKNSLKRDTQPLKGRDQTYKCSFRGIPKDNLVGKIYSVWKKNSVGGQILLRGWGWVWNQNLSVALLSQALKLPFILFLPPRARHLPQRYPQYV